MYEMIPAGLDRGDKKERVKGNIYDSVGLKMKSSIFVGEIGPRNEQNHEFSSMMNELMMRMDSTGRLQLRLLLLLGLPFYS